MPRKSKHEREEEMFSVESGSGKTLNARHTADGKVEVTINGPAGGIKALIDIDPGELKNWARKVQEMED